MKIEIDLDEKVFPEVFLEISELNEDQAGLRLLILASMAIGFSKPSSNHVSSNFIKNEEKTPSDVFSPEITSSQKEIDSSLELDFNQNLTRFADDFDDL